MKRLMAMIVLIGMLPFVAHAQIYNVRQWKVLMGARGWPLYVDGDRVGILDSSGSAKEIAANRLTPEESQYVAELKLPDKSTFEKQLLAGESTQAARRRAEDATKKKNDAEKAAAAAQDVVQYKKAFSPTTGALQDVAIVESHRAERQAALKTASAMRLLSKDETAHAEALEKYKRWLTAKQQQPVRK